MQKCLSCGGTYNAIQADGTTYFHACPPLSRVELAAAVAAGKVALPPGETADDAVTRRVYTRANPRDENVPSSKPSDAGKLKAAGAGVTTVADPAPVVVQVGP